jgi:hypothetical protein
MTKKPRYGGVFSCHSLAIVVRIVRIRAHVVPTAVVEVAQHRARRDAQPFGDVARRQERLELSRPDWRERSTTRRA